MGRITITIETRLAHLCTLLGGQLWIVSADTFQDLCDRAPRKHGFSSAPFTSGMGIDYYRKIVYVRQGDFRAGQVIHEMGHVFASEVHPESMRCDEWPWLGWEIAAARVTHCMPSWLQHMKHYVVGGEEESDPWPHGTDWDCLTPIERRAVLHDRLACAKRLGLVSRAGRPISIRGAS